jgi:hypothetical protein
VATGAASNGYVIGDRVEAELVFYPSALPLRAQIARILSGAQATAAEVELPDGALKESFAGYETGMAQLPWLGAWPLTFKDAKVRRTGEALFLCDSNSALALPLHSAQAALALPLATAGAMDGIGLWNGYHLTLCWAQTELGRWVNG